MVTMMRCARVRTQTLGVVVLSLLASAPCSAVPAAPAAAGAATSAPSVDPCRATVLKFEQGLAIMRQTQGNKAGAELKEKLLPAKLESEILLKDGYCGLARYIQEKKLDR